MSQGWAASGVVVCVRGWDPFTNSGMDSGMNSGMSSRMDSHGLRNAFKDD